MIINNVRIFVNPQADESSLKATATMLVNNQLLLQSIRIFQDEAKTSDGDPVFRIVYPVQRVNSDDLRHCMYPSNAEARNKFNAAILEAYHKVMSGEADQNTVVFSADTERTHYEITRASIYPSGRESAARAKVGLELDGELWLRGINLTVRENGSLLLNMPRRQVGEKESMAYFHPVDQTARNSLTAAVLPYYEEVVRASRKNPA